MINKALCRDAVFDIIRSAASDKFNFTSIFMDERDGDEQPNLDEPPPPPPTYGKPSGRGYVVYQTAVHYDTPGTKSVNEYYPSTYNARAPNPSNGYNGQGYQQPNHNRESGYGQQRQIQHPVAGAPPARRPVQYPQGNIRETRSYGHNDNQPRNYGGNNRFEPGDQQRSIPVPDDLETLAFNDDDGPEVALQRAVNAAPDVDPPLALWRPFYPQAARHVVDAVRHTR